MTEEEAKKALFELHYDYMSHSPKERLELYDEYIQKRNNIKEQLSRLIIERKQVELSNKIIR